MILVVLVVLVVSMPLVVSVLPVRLVLLVALVVVLFLERLETRAYASIPIALSSSVHILANLCIWFAFAHEEASAAPRNHQGRSSCCGGGSSGRV